MIKINLTPIEELENPYWWIPDVVTLAVVLLLSFGGVYIYLDFTRDEIAQLETSQAMMEQEIQNIQPDVQRYNNLNEKITKLESKKRSLQRITESKLIRYLPVILLENLQALRPEGLWFRKLSFNDQQPADQQNNEDNPTGINLAEVQGQEFPVEIELIGRAFDNIIIAEFMTALKSTQTQAYEQSDVRTQLFFSNVELLFSEISTTANEQQADDEIEFRLILKFRERRQQSPDLDAKLSRFIKDFRRNGEARMRL